jgi:hypothetical protein
MTPKRKNNIGKKTDADTKRLPERKKVGDE